MSRLVKFMIVLLAIAVATPVLAEDRLSLGGQMRVRGWHVDVQEPDTDNTQTWVDQRLRIGGKFSVAEGVSVTFRFDATEASWGSQPGFGGGRLVNTDTSMQWDRAHLDLEKGMFHLRAGQQFVGFGLTGFDAQDSGLTLMTKGAVPVTLFMMVDNDGGSRVASDAFYYGANVGHKTDAYAANVFVAAQKDEAEEEVYVVGMTYAQSFDALKLYTELEYFTGDASATVDAYGLQAFVDVSAAVAETVTIGGQFFYAMGDDEDVQYQVLGNEFNGWDPIYALGTGLDNEQIALGRPFTVLGNGAGLYAGRFYANMKATDAITFSGSVFYGVNDEEDVAVFEDAMAFGVGMNYAFMPNTSLGVQAQWADFSGEGNNADAEVISGGVGLFVNF